MKATVIYHSADYDGIFCREIARRFLGGEGVEYIGWNHGDPRVPFPKEGAVFIMDLNPDCLCNNPALTEPEPEGCFWWDRIVWIDHHKTSIERWPERIPGYRIDGVAACRLAWQWFATYGKVVPAAGQVLPSKEQFYLRRVTEPLAVRMAGEYDVWDKRDPDAEVFQYGLKAAKEVRFDVLLSAEWEGQGHAAELLRDGYVAQRYAQNVDAGICKNLTWVMEWEGLKWLCVNHARFNSLLFAAKDTPETGHDALLGFKFDGKKWVVSLYHAGHRKDLDLSEIAQRYGGGGHRGACGFTCDTLPFIGLTPRRQDAKEGSNQP